VLLGIIPFLKTISPPERILTMRIGFKQVLLTIIKNSISRYILFIALGASVFFPVYSSYFIFPEFSSQLTDYAEDAAVRVADHLRDSIFKNSMTLTKQSFSPDIEKEIQDVMRDLRIEKIQVFSKSGEVIFSSNPEDVGKMNTHEYFLTHVALGKLYSKMVQKNSKTLEGRTVNAEVLETYVPLLSKGGFEGAIEVYYDITANRTSLTALLNRLKTVIAVFHLIFLLVVFFILIKAGRNTLERDMAETLLQKAYAELERQVAERTAELKKTNQSLMIEIENQRRSDLALRDSENRLKAILESNPDPIIMYDLKGHPQFLNPAFTSKFGWTLDEVKSGIIPFVPDDQKQLTIQKIKEMYEYGKILAFETKRLTKDNQTLDFLISAALIRGSDGTPDGVVVNLTDISGKKALEAQYKHAQKMESIGTLAGGIAHDFNNILAGIMGYSQLARMNISDPEKAGQDLDQVMKAADRAKDLVRQILTFSRQSEYRKQSLKMYIIVKEALKLIRSSIPSTIEIKDDMASKASVMADPTQIHQVIMNLCTNAYHAMRDTGGLLTVALKEIRVPGPDNLAELNMIPGGYLRLQVSDTGSGIEPDIMDKIFDPYFSTKAPDKGTGLGLAVVHGIVKDGSGYIKVHSRPGLGTDFYVFLPISEEKETSCDALNDCYSLVGGTEKIMMVDDEENIRNSAAEFLEDLGYQVFPYSNGREALEAFMKNPRQFDFIISDVTMPFLTGDALAASVLKIRSDLPIILCSGYNDKISNDTLLDIGIYQCLDKPVSLKKLAFIIREKLDEISRSTPFL
jgi:PAS domain S-box-containing protein